MLPAHRSSTRAMTPTLSAMSSVLRHLIFFGSTRAPGSILPKTVSQNQIKMFHCLSCFLTSKPVILGSPPGSPLLPASSCFSNQFATLFLISFSSCPSPMNKAVLFQKESSFRPHRPCMNMEIVFYGLAPSRCCH